MLKGALFSALNALDTDITHVVDLYAGTGALGIEALSRGAEWCDFVERNSGMARVIQANLKVTGLDSRAAVHTGDITRVVPALEPGVTLILADPPYDDTEAWPTMAKLAATTVFDRVTATIAVEHSSRGDAPASLAQFRLRKTIKHGDGAVAIYVASDDN